MRNKQTYAVFKKNDKWIAETLNINCFEKKEFITDLDAIKHILKQNPNATSYMIIVGKGGTG